MNQGFYGILTGMLDLFGTFEFGIEFYPYQERAIETVLNGHKNGKQRFHIVAPPGAGKTLMGLEIIRRIGHKAVILSPNRAIQAQWVEKFRSLTVDVSLAPGLWQAEDIVAQNRAADTPMLSLTYQGFSVKSREEEQWLHKNVLELYTYLQSQDYKTLVLDECHHLMAHWAESIQYFLEQQPDTNVLGLTATPPVDRDQESLNRYLALVGPVDYEVPAPAVIKQGHLAPFQDLLYLVRPNPVESQFILKAHESLRRLVTQLETGVDDMPALSFWAEDWLLHPIDHRGQAIALHRQLDLAPDLTIAAMRYLRERGLFPPAQVPWLDEMEHEMEMQDYVKLLSAYGLAELRPREHSLWSQLLAALSELGYRFRQGRFHRRAGTVDKILALSAAKLRAMEQILKLELRCQQDYLRVLILTDFETTHAAGGRAALKGVLDPEAGGAVAVMRYLTAEPELDELEPLLVTGKTLLCDDDFLPTFLAEAHTFIAERNLEASLEYEPLGPFYKITGSGRDWHSQTYVLLATDLLEKGLTRCLVGTRGLFGEGWDCLSLNTLVDLTGVSSYVSVNQIRGRSLRRDPDQNLKLANNWDIVSVMPELEGGYSDLERVIKKHAHFYGLSDDGCLEKGIGHVHPLLSQLNHTELLQEMGAINQDMLERGENRHLALAAWKVGEPYRGEEISSVQLRFMTRPKQLGSAQAPAKHGFHLNQSPAAQAKKLREIQLQLQNEKANLTAHQHQVLALQNRTDKRGKWLLAQGLFSVLGVFLLSHGFGLIHVFSGVWLLLIALASGGFLDQAWRFKRLKKQYRALLLRPPPISQAAVIAEALHIEKPNALLYDLTYALVATLKELGELDSAFDPCAIEVISRHDGTRRIVFHETSPDVSLLLSQTLSELLGAIQDQRYLLTLYHQPFTLQAALGSVPEIRLEEQEILGYLPVPHRIGSSRGHADIFLKYINQYVAPGTLHYTRQGAGRELKQTLLRERPLQVKPQLLKVWE